MATRKLVDKDGVILGVVTFPDYWGERLDERGSVYFFVPEIILANPFSLELARQLITVSQGAFFNWYTKHGEDAVMLEAIDIETFEKIPECSFSPSAAYLRSIMG